MTEGKIDKTKAKKKESKKLVEERISETHETNKERLEEKPKVQNVEDKKATAENKEALEAKVSKKEETQKVKRYEAVSKGYSLPLSKKHGMYICRFIKNKGIDQAIADLNLVILGKKAVPFKGEIPHRRGLKGSGRYPIKASKYFINLLKGLKGNAIINGLELENTKIYFANASWASRQMRSGGRLAKRTNVTLKAKAFLTRERRK